MSEGSRLRARRGFGHTRIWWLFNDNGNCQPASVFAALRERNKATFDKMLAILDYTERAGPPPYPNQYKPLGAGLFEFKVSKPAMLRLYAEATKSGWLIVYAGTSKKGQSHDIEEARKRQREARERGCDFE